MVLEGVGLKTAGHTSATCWYINSTTKGSERKTVLAFKPSTAIWVSPPKIQKVIKMDCLDMCMWTLANF